MKYLSIGPGAMGIYALIGALKGVESELHEVKEIAGASAGSILALFMGLGRGQLQKSLSAINLANHFIWAKEFLYIPLFYPWI